MAVSQAQLDALNAALANGERMVKHGDKLVEYRSVDDLIKARDDLQKQLNAQTDAAAGTPRPKQTLLYQRGRGFDCG